VKGTRLTTKDILLLVVTVLSVVAAASWLFYANCVQRVFLVSELGLPLEIAFDGRVTRLGARGQTEVSMLTGVHELKVSANGQVVDEGPVDIPSGDGVVAYNALGAAPLYNEAVHYGSGAASAETFEFHGGQRLVISRKADFVFTTPPPSISVEQSSTSSHTRWHFARAEGGWQTTVGVLEERGLSEAALAVSLNVAEKDPTAGDAVVAAATLLQRRRGADPALAYLEKAIVRQPENYELHSTHLHFLRRADRFEQARTYYREFRRTHAGTLPFILLARTESKEAALALYQEVQAKEPDNKLARRGQAYLFLELGRYPESAELYAQVAAADPDYKHYVDDHVRSLLHQGLFPEALDVAHKAVDKQPNDWRLAVLHAQLALAHASLAPGGQASGSPIPTLSIDRLAQKTQDPGFGVWMRSLVGLPVDEAVVKKDRLQGAAQVLAARIQVAAAQDPALAWDLCAKAKSETLDRLFSPVALLLGSEFLRAGDSATADRLLSGLGDMPLPTSAFTAYVMDGIEHPELWRLDHDARAALDFIRARKLQAEGASGEVLYAEALRREAWPGIVNRARLAWPAPRPGKPTLTLVRRPEPAPVLLARQGSRG